jgi:hypothetical protein
MNESDLEELFDNSEYVIDPNSVKSFDSLMEKLGYSQDDSPIHLGKEKEKRQVNYMCPDGSAMAAYLFLIPWLNKRSYVYDEFAYAHYYKSPFLEDKIKIHTDHIIYEEKTRVAEVGWEIIYTKEPKEFNLNTRKQIIFNICNQIEDCLKNGLYEYKPQPGDILVSRPLGPKIDQGFTESSIELGTRQRGIIAKKFGFGEVYPNDLQYARYNDQLTLEPL